MEFEKCYDALVSSYLKRTPQSAASYERASQFLAGGETRSVSYYNPYPLTIDHGLGCKIYDLDGNEYIDCVNNYTSLIHGHANPIVTEAMIRAASQGTAVPAGIGEQVKLAEMLCRRVPSVERIRFCNSGTEATLFAVRAAKAYMGRQGIVKIFGGYHGTTDMMEYNVSCPVDYDNIENNYIPKPDIRGVSEAIASEMYVIPYNDLAAAEKVLQESADKIAAIIVEPFLGAGGLIPADPGYLAGLRALTIKYGVLLIFDEVQAFRLSDGGAQKRFGVTPDISAFGKIIGGGLAVGAFGGKKEIMDLFDPRNPGFLSQSGTFNGNRPTMAAGLAAVTLYDQTACDRLERLAEKLEANIESAFANSAFEGCVTRSGSLMNYHFMKDKPHDYIQGSKDDKRYLKLLHLEMLERGVFIAPRGMFVLSTPMTDAVIDEISEKFVDSLKDMERYI